MVEQEWLARAEQWGLEEPEISLNRQQIHRARTSMAEGRYEDALSGFEEARKHLQICLNSTSRAPTGWVICDSTPGFGHWAKEVIDPRTNIRFRLVEPGTFLMGSPEPVPSDRMDTTSTQSMARGETSDKKIPKATVKMGLPDALRHFFNRPNDQAHRKTSTLPNEPAPRMNERPQHEVVISKPFYLASMPTTDDQWDQASERPIPKKLTGFAAFEHALKTLTGLPKVYVSWQEAFVFCKHFGYRLPTEAEWEYVCRAGTTTSAYGPLDAIAWYADNSGGTVHKVAEKQSNPWGFFDMLGNVFEWCSDIYEKDAYKKSVQLDPFVRGDSKAIGDSPQNAEAARLLRVRRGGSYVAISRYVQAADRRCSSADTKAPDIGFRCVKEL
jgi:formylglycine-generating enzyme required for sulfatase activity